VFQENLKKPAKNEMVSAIRKISIFFFPLLPAFRQEKGKFIETDQEYCLFSPEKREVRH
jgi:hypothetical protein